MRRYKIFNDKCVLKHKNVCSRCGKAYFTHNMYTNSEIYRLMESEQICWECAYWEKFMLAPPEHTEVIGNRCYQILPFVQSPDIYQILGGGGEVRYFLKKDGTCCKSNDIWWLNIIPWQYQQQLKPTGWWITKRFYERLIKMKQPCTARGCLDRYRCYRYQYQLEFTQAPYNAVPRDWVAGDEHCPAFLPLSEIQGYDEYVKPSDIIDENSVALNHNNYEQT